MRFLYCKLQAKALLALHVYGRQYLHAGTAAVREPALSLSRAHAVYLTLWAEDRKFVIADKISGNSNNMMFRKNNKLKDHLTIH